MQKTMREPLDVTAEQGNTQGIPGSLSFKNSQ